MRAIRMSGSMSEVWRRSQGRTSEAPPDERGGNRYVRPTATAPHLDSTEPCRLLVAKRTAGIGVRREKAALSSGCKAHPATAPAGSNRSSHGGNEMAEAFE